MSLISLKFNKLIFKAHYAKVGLIQAIQSRYGSYKASPYLSDIPEVNIKYETTSNPEEWKYVERLLPIQTVPQPFIKDQYLSDWRPPSKEALNQPYFVRRTKNYMLPVYMETTYRGMRRLTYIKRIQGNIWRMENEIREYLKADSIKPIRIQVHEVIGQICIHGDHVNKIKHWLMQKNF